MEWTEGGGRGMYWINMRGRRGKRRGWAKDWGFPGGGGILGSGGIPNPTIYNTGSKYTYFRVIILIVEKR